MKITFIASSGIYCKCFKGIRMSRGYVVVVIIIIMQSIYLFIKRRGLNNKLILLI